MSDGNWTVQDHMLPYPGPGMTRWMTEIFPVGSVDILTAKIVDDNARRLYGIDPGFRPAPPPPVDGLALPPGLAANH